MLTVSKEYALSQIREARENIEAHYNASMEAILNKNSDKDIYWILGKLKFPPELGGKVGRTFLQACAEKPGLVAESFVYEVDNKRGVKTLLWVLNPDGSLRLPTLNKTIQATAPKKRIITGSN